MTAPDRGLTRAALHRPAILAASMLASIALSSAPSRADIPDLFIVRDVPVDATDKTETAAREAARLQGEQDALRTLLQRLAAPADYPRLPTPSPSAAANAVLSFEVVRERSSDVRYIGQLTYRFKPAAVRRMLRDAGISYSELPPKPILVLPVLVSEDGTQIWTDNPWRAAWTKLAASSPSVPITLPTGDASDMVLVAAGDLAQPTPEIPAGSLAELSGRYGAGDVAIATLRMAPGNLGPPSVFVDRIAATDTTIQAAHPVAIPSAPTAAAATDGGVQPGGPGTPADLYARAAQAVLRDLDQASRRSGGAAVPVVGTSASRPPTAGTIALTIPIAGLSDWIGLRNRLLTLPEVASIEVTYLDQENAHATLAYRGDPAQLKTALGQKNLGLDEGTPVWTLRRPGQGMAPGSADALGSPGPNPPSPNPP